MTVPCAVYMRGSYPGQIDHPGWLSKVVRTLVELEIAQAEGWRLTMTDDPPAVPVLPNDWGTDPVTPTPRGRRWRAV